MLVLSRRRGESVVINDRPVLTIALLAEDFAELSPIGVDGAFLGSFTARTDESVSLPDNVQVTLIRFEGERVRLGVEGPPNCRFARGEYWDLPQKRALWTAIL